MLRNYWKLILRNLWNNKAYNFLNITGLAIGIACAALIFLWVEDEFNFDSFHAKRDRLYAVRVNWNFGGTIYSIWSTPGLLGPSIKAEIPGIVNTCRTSEDQSSLLITNNKSLYATGKFADPTLFSMFTFPFAQGNAADVFTRLNSIVLTEKCAKKLFGDEHAAIGRTLRMDSTRNYVVTGILKDLPQNSTLQFEWLVPFEIYFEQYAKLKTWTSSDPLTYVELGPNTDPAAVNRPLYGFIEQKASQAQGHAFLFSMKDWHLYDEFDNGKQTGSGKIRSLRNMSFIAWIILIIACINFMNLSTARSEKRAKEVGIRKVLGAEKRSLVFLFISETVFMSALAALMSVFIMALSLPWFNRLVEKQLSLGLTNPAHLLALLAIILTCGIIAGSYPSLYLSSFNPVLVLRVLRVRSGSATFIRKSLVVLQFTVSIVFIITTIVIYRQVQHVKARDLGFVRDGLIEINMQRDAGMQFPMIRQGLLATEAVANAGLCDHKILYGGDNSDDFTWDGKSKNLKVPISVRKISPGFITTAGMRIVQGKDFATNEGDGSPNVIISQSLAILMGGNGVVGKIIQMPIRSEQGGGMRSLTVTGVVNDYVYGDMYGKPFPVIFFCRETSYPSLIYVRMKPQKEAGEALAKIQAAIEKNNVSYPFQYEFVDDQFDKLFLTETMMGKISGTFAVLAILISCLGLFGLAAYSAERRTREIGIRKTLGASSASITGLLSMDFLKLIAFSALIAFPISWWTMHSWLNDYAYRISISWWIFLFAGGFALLIGLLTISFQSLKAAMTNPARSLRSQ